MQDATALDDLLAAISRFEAGALDAPRPPAALADDLVHLRRGCDALELAFGRLAARFAATDEYDAQGSVSPIAWLRHHCHMTGHAAASAICVGETAGTLTRSTGAMSAGRIGFAHLVLLARTADAVGGTDSDFDEGGLLHLAEAHSPNRFRRDCAHARHAADAAAFLAEQRDAVEARSLELRPIGDAGCWSVRGYLDAVGGATVRTALESLARPTGAGDDRTRPRRLADALVEVAAHALDTSAGASRGRQVPHLQVTTTLETLLGLPGAPAGEMEGAAPLAASTVQRVACSANVLRVLLGPDSAVVDVGRARRLPAPATRRAVVHRDDGCVWPGCDRSAMWTQVHHVLHWSRGGPTSADNLVLLCHRHHWMAHEGGWQVVRTAADGEVRAIPPLPGVQPLIRGPSRNAAA